VLLPRAKNSPSGLGSSKEVSICPLAPLAIARSNFGIVLVRCIKAKSVIKRRDRNEQLTSLYADETLFDARLDEFRQEDDISVTNLLPSSHLLDKSLMSGAYADTTIAPSLACA
jgi:hypothetical protein